MTIVTLTTDYRTDDPYLAMLKAKLLTASPGLTLLDVSHGVGLSDIGQAGLTVGTALGLMPAGTIHLVTVAETEGDGKAVAFSWKDQLIVSMDNGFPSILTQEVPADEIVALTLHEMVGTFPSLSLVDAVAQLASGKKLSEVGQLVEEFAVKKRLGEAILRDDQIMGVVQYVDSQGNLITNIKRKDFERIRSDSRFEIRAGTEKLNKIHQHYGEKGFGDCMAVFNAANWLEIAIHTGSASQLLGMKVGSPISISFDKVRERGVLI